MSKTPNPFRPESNGDNAAFRLGRPARHIAAYKDVSDDALNVLREWFDQAAEERKAAAERKARFAEWEQTEEAEQARREFAARF